MDVARAGEGGNGGGPARQKVRMVVFVPAHAEVYQGRKEPAFEVRERPDGGRDLPVFTSLERLVQALGPYQPWVALPLAEVRDRMVTAGIDRLTLDPAGSPGMWRWGLEDLQALHGQILASREEAPEEGAGNAHPERRH
jgi:hypothetical protein